MKKRIVVIGSAGFVGSHIVKALDPKAYEVVGLSRKDCDFADERCRAVIGGVVKDGDVVVCAAAKAPAKNLEMLIENVSMITNIAEAIRDKKLSYLLNIGSDAVYGDTMDKITESSVIMPLSAHGIMHCMREYILEKRIEAPIGHLRSTLIYGEDDPHNGYGPNSFIRSARGEWKIELFGNGEERRDHIFVGDVARIAVGMIERKIAYPVNAVTGTAVSFLEIAELIRGAAGAEIEIRNKPRSGPMPHNGYRAFSNETALKACPGLSYKNIGDYIHDRMNGKQHVI